MTDDIISKDGQYKFLIITTDTRPEGIEIRKVETYPVFNSIIFKSWSINSIEQFKNELSPENYEKLIKRIFQYL